MSARVYKFRPRPRADSAERLGTLFGAVRSARRHCEGGSAAWTISARQALRETLATHSWPLATRHRLEQALAHLDLLDSDSALQELRGLERDLAAGQRGAAA